MVLKKMIKYLTPLMIRINIVFLAFFLLLYVILLLNPSAASDYHQRITCSLRDCHHKIENGVKMKAVLEEPGNGNKSKARTREVIKREKPSFLRDSNIRRGMRIATVNMEDEGVSDWSENWEIIPIP